MGFQGLPVVYPLLLMLFWSALNAQCEAGRRPRIDLDGAWQFRMDPESAGEAGSWASSDVVFADTIRVPGWWQAQGFGKRTGVLRNHYAGDAWYRRTVSIPSSWGGKIVMLRVGGVHRRAAIFVNGVNAGAHDGFSTPFSIDISAHIRAGADNILALKVSNPGDNVWQPNTITNGTDAIGTLNYLANWGGIYGHVELEALERIWIERVDIWSDIAKKQAHFHVVLNNRENRTSRRLAIEIAVGEQKNTAEVEIEPARNLETDVTVDLPAALLWSPEHPNLYNAIISLREDTHALDRVEERFGMREIVTRGNVLLLNGKPVYVRGFTDDNIEVLTGSPPVSKQIYLERLRSTRSQGFNAVRCHSRIPVPAFFDAADETDTLVMAELPAMVVQYFWPNKDFLRNEMERVLHTHQNHPSFMSLAFGTEFNVNQYRPLRGKEHERERQEADEDLSEGVAKLYRLAKSIDPRRLFLSNDGFLLRPTDMAVVMGVPSEFAGDIPFMRHEFGEYLCSLPDISLSDKFTGVLVPTWLERKKEWADQQGLAELYPAYVRNSQRLLQLAHKYQIETTRKMPGFAGYTYQLITDYPGGTGEGDSWDEGWYDFFWKPKTPPEEGRLLNSPVLLMIGAGPGERTLWNSSQRLVQVWVSNYGEEEIDRGLLSWRLMDRKTVLQASKQGGVRVPLSTVVRAGEFTINPVELPEAMKLDLVLELQTGTATYKNHWDLWVFPKQGLMRDAPVPVISRIKWPRDMHRIYPFVREGSAEDPRSVLIVSTLDDTAARFLESGGRVWLMADQAQLGLSGDAHLYPVQSGAQGTLLQSHPALDGFPHEGFCDLQFYNLVERGWNFPLDTWPRELTPIAGVIWAPPVMGFLNPATFTFEKGLSKAAYMFEVRTGPGRLLVTTLRLREHLDDRYPEAVYLFDRLLRYVSGPKFEPRATVSKDLWQTLVVR
jgi:hypothetical protein